MNAAACCVCLETKENGVKCEKCADTFVCEHCCFEMGERGNYRHCPVCRQSEWYNVKEYSFVPEHVIVYVREEEIRFPRETIPYHNTLFWVTYGSIGFIVIIGLIVLASQ